MRRENLLRALEVFVMHDPQLRFTFEEWNFTERSGQLLVLRDALYARAFDEAAHEPDLAD